MRRLSPISLESAARLVDFRGRSSAVGAFADGQLEGAVTAFNMLATRRMAYLADEVGMGKTYVALGAISLMRHIQGGLKVLYVVPRENMQNKWRKELKNFAAFNWQSVDHRVKDFRGRPVNRIVLCDNLLDLVHQVSLYEHADFILRMPSFSLALADNSQGWAKLRDKLFREMPWLEEHRDRFSLRDKEEFKNAFARAVNAAIPAFDLVVIDEGHNLKHGRGPGASTRNRVLARVLGSNGEESAFTGGGRKANRVLILSATPIETDFRELWNQLDVLGMGGEVPNLARVEIDDDVKKQIVRGFLIRRVARLRINGEYHTKNMYRREWRGGGLKVHDEPLHVEDLRQRLIVALIQKKVSEVFDLTGRKETASRRFKRSFQIGMLSSFESFFQTARLQGAGQEEESNFDQADQTKEKGEKEGVDTPTVDRIAERYKRRFGESMPHPKMDAVAQEAWDRALEGEKTLIFVRRIASVREIAQKIGEHYDAWLSDYLTSRLASVPEVQKSIRMSIEEYRARKSRFSGRVWRDNLEDSTLGLMSDEDDSGTLLAEAEKGGMETFFHWYFRGKSGPEGILSGAAFKKNRFASEGSVLSTFFEENYLTLLLGRESDPLGVLAETLGKGREAVSATLRDRAYRIFRAGSTQEKYPRFRVYHAYQQAALHLLSETDSPFSGDAKRLAGAVYGVGDFPNCGNTPDAFPSSATSLWMKTLITEIGKKPGLDGVFFPKGKAAFSVASIREREQRKELLRAAVLLGHPFIDLWLLTVRKLGTLRLGAADMAEKDAQWLVEAFLKLLEEQRDSKTGFSSYRELKELSENFGLILDVNFSEIREKHLQELGRFLQATLSNQTPVGMVWGGINSRLVKQFRMPGYPAVLVTTDVLQEGEDLHPFCSRVVHYGITWTPSAMEQRTGRVDRIGSKTYRLLEGETGVTAERFLQVHYPYLRDTVELIQVREVFRRINRFLEMMHEVVRGSKKETSTVDVDRGMLGLLETVEQIKTPLRSSFEVNTEDLKGGGVVPLGEMAPGDDAARCHLESLLATMKGRFQVDIVPDAAWYKATGRAYVGEDALLPRGRKLDGCRQHPFTLSLCPESGDGQLLLRCRVPLKSGIGPDLFPPILRAHQACAGAKLVLFPTRGENAFNIEAETNLLFHPRLTQPEEVAKTIASAVLCTDFIERNIWGKDLDHSEVQNGHGELESEED